MAIWNARESSSLALAMKVLAIIILLLPAVSLADKPTPVTQAVKRPAVAPRDAARAIVVRHAEAIEKRDVATLDKLYADDAELLIIENAGADKSWKQYRDHHLAPELAAAKDLRYRYTNIRVEAEGALAWATFEYELHLVLKDKPIDVAGRGTMVLREQADAWKIVHSHTSGKKK